MEQSASLTILKPSIKVCGGKFQCPHDLEKKALSKANAKKGFTYSLNTSGIVHTFCLPQKERVDHPLMQKPKSDWKGNAKCFF